MSIVSTLRNRRVIVALIVLLIAGAGIVALTLGGRDSVAVADKSASSTERIHLAALQAARSQQDTDAPFLRNDSLKELGYDLASGRVLAVNAAGSQVIVVPRIANGPDVNENVVCLVVTAVGQPQRGAGTCPPVARFNAEGAFVTLSRGNPDTDEVVGVLPDGITTITVSGGSAQSRKIEVKDNVVRFPSGGATSATWVGADGSTVERSLSLGLKE